MFRINWKKDKVGFVNTWALTTIFVGAVVALVVLIGLAVSNGDWAPYTNPIKGVIVAWWVLSMVFVLIRIAVYRIGMVRKREKLKLEEQNKAEGKS